MIVSIMQPYFFPYLGYFQLMAASDVFVAYDDVQFIKGGWVHRNRILLNGAPVWMSFPVVTESHTLQIRQREYIQGRSHRTKLLRRLEGAYRQAPNFEATMNLVEKILTTPERNVAVLNTYALQEIASAIGLHTRIVTSSSLDKDNVARGAERVVSICGSVGAKVYLNAIGGVNLYDADFFEKRGLILRFIKPQFPEYGQSSSDFVGALSIIDVMMNIQFSDIGRMLGQYRILTPEEARPVAVAPAVA
jgi:hypothetical protein